MLLRDGNDEHKAMAAGVLTDLAVCPLKQKSIVAVGGIQLLVELLRDGDSTQRFRATSALGSLVASAENTAEIYACDGVPLLIAMARDGSDGQKSKARRALRRLAANPLLTDVILTSDVYLGPPSPSEPSSDRSEEHVNVGSPSVVSNPEPRAKRMETEPCHYHSRSNRTY